MCVIIDSSNSKGDGSMKFIISGKNITVTEGLKTAVQDKLSKLERYFTPDTEVVVTLSVEKERQKIEVTIPMKGNIIRSEQVSNDMYVSIDLVEEVIERQLRKYKNKIVEKDATGEEIRPFDISITKNVLALFVNSVILVAIMLGCARWYKRHEVSEGAPKGGVGMIEALVVMINDEVIKGCIGEDYRRYAPYLLTAFFFVLVNNLMGILPIFPGGANVTGNIAITLVLALCTFLFTNICGTKAYWKDIFWPKVPLWLKVPVPLMPMIELFGIFTKPFALMIRLFANIMAGHAAILSLVAIIFITVKAGPVINGSMTVISVLFGIFMDMLELLVAFIQAYVFTMLSAVFIGLSRVKEEN